MHWGLLGKVLVLVEKIKSRIRMSRESASVLVDEEIGIGVDEGIRVDEKIRVDATVIETAIVRVVAARVPVEDRLPQRRSRDWRSSAKMIQGIEIKDAGETGAVGLIKGMIVIEDVEDADVVVDVICKEEGEVLIWAEGEEDVMIAKWAEVIWVENAINVDRRDRLTVMMVEEEGLMVEDMVEAGGIDMDVVGVGYLTNRIRIRTRLQISVLG